MVVNLETGKARKVTSENVGAPSWSPDGRHIIAVSLRNKNGSPTGLSVIPVMGGSAMKLKLEASQTSEASGPASKGVSSPDWSPDGKQISFGVGARRWELLLIDNVIPGAQIRKVATTRRR